MKLTRLIRFLVSIFAFCLLLNIVPQHVALGASFLVDTTTDGTLINSLRQAILDSNASVGVPDTITFNIAGAGPHTLSLLSALPNITDPVIIDGLTQPGSSC